MDELDLRILKCLNENARTSYKIIGEKIGLTPPAVAQRVQKLEEEGVIEGYTVKLNQHKLGNVIKAIITVKVAYGRFGQFSQKFAQCEEVNSYHRITGDDCAMMHAHFKDNEHLVSFLDQLSMFGTTKTNIILEEIISD